jgi:hypothetical protein
MGEVVVVYFELLPEFIRRDRGNPQQICTRNFWVNITSQIMIYRHNIKIVRAVDMLLRFCLINK